VPCAPCAGRTPLAGAACFCPPVTPSPLGPAAACGRARRPPRSPSSPVLLPGSAAPARLVIVRGVSAQTTQFRVPATPTYIGALRHIPPLRFRRPTTASSCQQPAAAPATPDSAPAHAAHSTAAPLDVPPCATLLLLQPLTQQQPHSTYLLALHCCFCGHRQRPLQPRVPSTNSPSPRSSLNLRALTRPTPLSAPQRRGGVCWAAAGLLLGCCWALGCASEELGEAKRGSFLRRGSMTRRVQTSLTQPRARSSRQAPFSATETHPMQLLVGRPLLPVVRVRLRLCLWIYGSLSHIACYLLSATISTIHCRY
jgi:hypothetical protein